MGSDEPSDYPFSFSFFDDDPEEHICPASTDNPLTLLAEFPDTLADVEFLLKWFSSLCEFELIVPVVLDIEMVAGLVLPFLGLSSFLDGFSS